VALGDGQAPALGGGQASARVEEGAAATLKEEVPPQPVQPLVTSEPVRPPSPAPGQVYHLELRHFPRNLCSFNLSAEELHDTVLVPWLADRPFELGDLKWDPRQARLVVLEGPRLPAGELTMGRGWRAAQRRSKDVTAQLLGAAR
jgi:hypothetical protein